MVSNFILFVTQETEQPECSLLKFVGITSCRVVKSTWLPPKITAYSTLQVATILVAMAPKILELAT